jgi:N utilization substance protein B
MASGRRERETAVQVLYQVEGPGGVLPADPSAGVQAYFDNFEQDAGSREDVESLVHGVCQKGVALDQVIEKHSTNWRLERMAKVDRNILRLAAFELMERPAVPMRVVLNEAVELGKRFGSESSSAFINGILDPVAREVRTT